MSILEVKGMTMAFGGLIAVSDLSFSVADNEVVGLIGPNGSGKSTVINCISGFHTPRSGEVLLSGQNIIGLKPHQIAALGLSRTFQLTNLLPKQTVLDNVLTGMHLHAGETFWDAMAHSQRGNKKERRLLDKAMALLDFLGMSGDSSRLCQAVSHYSRKRLGLAIALAVQPKMLLVDEIVSGLSGEEVGGVMNCIRKIRESGVSILLVEHNMRVIMNLCHRIVVINFGSKIAEGTPAEIGANRHVQEAYLGK